MSYAGSNQNGVPWSKEYRSGARARRDGLTALANHWNPDTHAHVSWAHGWWDEDQRIEGARALTKETKGEA